MTAARVAAPVAGFFDSALTPLVAPGLADLSAELAATGGLTDPERARVVAAVDVGLRTTLGRLLTRLLLLELGAARVSGRLRAPTSALRWIEFLDGCTDPAWWTARGAAYPTMLPRVERVVRGRVAAGAALARRFAADRHDLACLLDGPAGELLGVEVGLGDSHEQGASVGWLHTDAGPVLYKPRPLGIDAALARLLDALRAHLPSLRIRVPEVLDRGSHGWAAHVEHRYCADAAELAAFYRGTGHWLAVMRLLGGGDLHAENIVADGQVPVVVDCETLLAPFPERVPSGYGEANDRGAALIAESVLRAGLLPTRGIGLGWRGVDSSAVGGLTGEQPLMTVPTIIDDGLDTARLGFRRVAPSTVSGNHPSPEPSLSRYWPDVLAGFRELTELFGALDSGGALDSLLDGLRDHRVRVVLRDTEVYAEHARMLWHPASLHDEATAVARTAALLRAQGRNNPGVPFADDVVAAEIIDMLHGDVPVFVTTPRRGRLTGPSGTSFGPEEDLVTAALRRWRRLDPGLEARVIRASLVGAYLNDGRWADADRMPAAVPDPGPWDARRRAVAAGLLRQLRDTAIRGGDGTATWIAPVLDATGWQVQTSSPDLYNGLSGTAVLLAGYAAEAVVGRADPVPGTEDLLHDVVTSLALAEDRDRALRASGSARPPVAGGYLGLGSQIWAWLVLHRLGVPAALERAVTAAAELPAAVDEDAPAEVLGGTAGAVVPLLHLADVTGDAEWVAAADRIGQRLVAAADHGAGTACWRTDRWPQGLGGFAHGATGIGWALARLAERTGDPAAAATARAAAAHEESLYHRGLAGWLDVRESAPFTATAWCHGAGGIGLAAADLLARDSAADRERYRDVLRRAAASVLATGIGWNHTLCHGDVGAWEVLDAALRAGVAPAGVDEAGLVGGVVASLETNGVVSGLARDAYAPGLLSGAGGVIWQLLRMDPASSLPSVLVMDLPPYGSR